MPLKSMLDHGLTIAGGSDAPCSIPDAIGGIHAACNHPNPEQRISILDAVQMYTRSAARLSFDEEERGTLTDGKVADFVVLDRNPLTQKPEDLKDIKVLQLYLKGQTYEPSIRTPADLCIRAFTNILLKR